MVNNSTNNMQDDNLENVNKHILADNDSSSRAEEFGFTVILKKLFCVSTDFIGLHCVGPFLLLEGKNSNECLFLNIFLK